MQTETAKQSCTISIADDGEVGFIVSSKDALYGEPCQVTIAGSALVIRQGDIEIVSIEDVSDEFGDAIRKAPGLCMINVLDAGKPHERIVVNRQLALA